MIRFGSDTDFVEVDLVSEESDDLPSRGDANLAVRVLSGGFSGSNQLWAEADSIQAFCAALVDLEAKLQGEARVEGISPGELELRVFNVDSRGHLAVEGMIGRDFRSEHTSFPHSVRFGLEFEPSQLGAAVKVSWVRRNAAL